MPDDKARLPAADGLLADQPGRRATGEGTAQRALVRGGVRPADGEADVLLGHGAGSGHEQQGAERDPAAVQHGFQVDPGAVTQLQGVGARVKRYEVALAAAERMVGGDHAVEPGIGPGEQQHVRAWQGTVRQAFQQPSDGGPFLEVVDPVDQQEQFAAGVAACLRGAPPQLIEVAVAVGGDRLVEHRGQLVGDHLPQSLRLCAAGTADEEGDHVGIGWRVRGQASSQRGLPRPRNPAPDRVRGG